MIRPFIQLKGFKGFSKQVGKNEREQLFLLGDILLSGKK